MKIRSVCRLLPILFLLLVGCKNNVVNPPAPPPLKDWTITVTFQYNFTNYVICSATVTTGCVNGFTYGYLNGTTQVPLATVATTVCTGATQPESCSAVTNSQLPIGSLTFYVVANYINNTGVAGSSPADDTANPTVVPAGAATSLSVAIQ